MAISRRDFFTETFGKIVQHAHKVIPGPMINLLNLEENKPLSAEESAFELVRRSRKKNITELRTFNTFQKPISGDKAY